jgi:hypothetical protein
LTVTIPMSDALYNTGKSNLLISRWSVSRH